MKNFLFLIISFLLFIPNVVYSQYCGAATTNVAITPTTTNQVTASYTSGRRAFNFAATAGCTYYFETCGLSTADTYLRLYSTGTGGTVLASGDDNCGTQSAITWTCVTSGTYSILMTNFSCVALTVSTSLRYRITGCAPPPTPPANNLCGSATSLACGTTNLAGTTVNASLKTAPGGGGLASNYGVWYTFVGNGNQTTLSSTGTGGFDIEMTIVQGTCATNTLVSSQDLVGSGVAETFTFTTVNATTYYVYIAYWSSTGTSTQTGTFTISRSCATPPPIPANDNCANATALTVFCPGITTNTNGTTLGATEDLIPDPSCDPGSIQDVWYSFNTGNNTQVDITAALVTASWLGMELYTSCGTLAVGPSATCDFNILSPNPTTITGLTMNTTYRLRIFTNTTYDTPGSFTIRLNTINNTMTLSSSASSQSVCINTTMSNITFNTTGASGSTFSGLPPGVSGSWLNNVVTISGIPTTSGTFNYTVTTTGGCSTASSFGVITVIDLVPTLSTITGNSTITPGTPETYSITPISGTNYVWEYTESITAVLWNVIPSSNSPSVTFTWPPSTTDGAVRVTVSNSCNSQQRTLLITTNSPLPVELMSFTGDCDGDKVIISWITATEHNSQYYDLSKSRDGVMWSNLSTVLAAGNSNQVLNYSVIDKNPYSDNNYYKLLQFDNDGKSKEYGPINVKCSSESSYFQVFPNPNGGDFQIIINDNKLTGDCQLVMLDEIGRLVFSKQVKVIPGINLYQISDTFEPGVYLVKVLSNQTETISIKVIIK